MIIDFCDYILVAATPFVVVVETGHRIGHIKDFVELSIGNKLHNLVHLNLNASWKAGRLRFRSVVEKATVEAEPKAPYSAQIPLHQLGIVSVACIVLIIQPQDVRNSGALKNFIKLSGLYGSAQNSKRFCEFHLVGKKNINFL